MSLLRGRRWVDAALIAARADPEQMALRLIDVCAGSQPLLRPFDASTQPSCMCRACPVLCCVVLCCAMCRTGLEMLLDREARSVLAYLLLLGWTVAVAADIVWQQIKVDATLGHLILGEPLGGVLATGSWLSEQSSL
jgi:hypothetical protein